MTGQISTAALSDAELGRLKVLLEKEVVPYLPALVPNTRQPADNSTKNLSRAFAGFVVGHICSLELNIAAGTVIDDFDDGGIDAVYYKESTKTLYLAQVKLRAGAEFQQAEAQAFTAGVRQFVAGNLAPFNAHVQARLDDLNLALDECAHITVVVAFVGNGISAHALAELNGVIQDDGQDEQRFSDPVLEFGPEQVRQAMDGQMAHPPVNARIKLLKCKKITEPRETWLGVVRLAELVDLYQMHGDSLFDKNLRNPLSDRTDVNKAIAKSLAENPADFFYMNNGITILAKKIDPKTARGDGQILDLREISIINGAQTVASATRFKLISTSNDISQAKATVTIIAADANGEFGKSVTKARNHQNPVTNVDFAALDDNQERLRREMLARGIRYAYKAQDVGAILQPEMISITEAAYALALLDAHPRNPLLLNSKPNAFRTPGEPEYLRIFPAGLASETLVNAVYVARHLSRLIQDAVTAEANPLVKETLRHGYYAHSWVLAKQTRDQITGAHILDPMKIGPALSVPADSLRQTIIDLTQAKMAAASKRAWALYRNHANLFELLEEIMISHYNTTDPQAVAARKAERPVRNNSRGTAVPLFDYPKPLFDYLCGRAPQIGNLT